MKFNLKSGLLAIIAVSIAQTSCQLDDYEVPASELYTREFIKQFGVFDKNHDWNLATRGSVKVNVNGSARVKVTAKIGGKNYLLANYADVSGERELQFDIPKGVSDITVISGDSRVKTTLGGQVSFNNVSRVVSDPSSDNGTGVTAELCGEDDWMVVPMLNATIFRRKMPEECYNAFREGVTNDFSFKFKKNDVIVRPLYWQTNQTLEFGFFILMIMEIRFVSLYMQWRRVLRVVEWKILPCAGLRQKQRLSWWRIL